MDKEHIVRSFDSELNELTHIIAQMGGLAEDQLANAIKALVRRDADLAAKVIVQDARIDELELEADDQALRLLALRQPKAVDLRAVLTSLKTATELERIGDYAKNVAKRTATVVAAPPVGGAAGSLGRMASVVQGMISNVLDAYINRDAAKAEDVRARDAEVDQLHTSLFRELVTYMMEDPRNITACTHLLFIAKNIERIGDHATNIAEYVLFLVAGKLPSDDRLKNDLSSSTLVHPEDAQK